MFRSLASLVGAVVCLFAAAASATEDVTVATMLQGLQSPCGLAIRPGASGDDYEIYVSDPGAGRVIRVRSGQPGTGEHAITGFASPRTGDNAVQSSGPRGLLFLDRTRLVVTGGEGDGHAFIRLYEVSDEQTPLAAERYEQHIEQAASGEQPAVVVKSFHGLARTLANDSVADMLVVVALGKQGSAGTWKVPIRAGTLGELEIFSSAQPRDELIVPGGIAVGRHGYIVVSEPIANDDAHANRLTFLNPIDGSVALELTVELPAVASLAYSPRTGNLHAAAFASSHAERGGIYRIDDVGEPGKPACAAVKIAEVARPTALAFGPDGALYVAALGESDGSETNTGVLLKLTGEL